MENRKALDVKTIVDHAVLLFESVGYHKVTLEDIAKSIECSLNDLYLFVGSKEDIVIYIYQTINLHWRDYVLHLPKQSLQKNFKNAMRYKVHCMKPYVAFLSVNTDLLFGSSHSNFQSQRTAYIRHISSNSVEQLIQLSTNGEKLRSKVADLDRIIFAAHWYILLVNIRTQDAVKTEKAIGLVAKMLKRLVVSTKLLAKLPLYSTFNQVLDLLVVQPKTKEQQLERSILDIVFAQRKLVGGSNCLENPCEQCYQHHLRTISLFTEQQKEIHFILPAFPAKSPNREKTLGRLPDLGEEIALRNLNDLCSKIAVVYKPGARVTICSDGRIFSELVGVSDADVSAYAKGIRDMIQRNNLSRVELINLEDLFVSGSFDEMRHEVLKKYAPDLDLMRDSLKTNTELQQLFNGMHRFVSEDMLPLHQESKSQVKKKAKKVALQIIQHSNAWTSALSDVYPDAVRLSIHPYAPHSNKIGIQLTKTAGNWLTPWHGVVVKLNNGYKLMKKAQAEELGAVLEDNNGAPWNYSLIE